MLRTSKLLELAWKPLVSSVRQYPYSKNFFDRLKLTAEPKYSQLENGLMIATEERPGTEHVCVGLFIDGGSRYESRSQNGIAYFFEHLVFTSTCKRDACTLRKDMEKTGARFNCFTSRELVAYYAECLSEDIQDVVDILCDCVYNNGLCFNDIEMQKELVMQEMIEKDVDANAILYDYLHTAAFSNTPLAQSVMGLSENLESYCEYNISPYLSKFFNPSRTVLAAVGGVCHEQLVSLAQSNLLSLDPVQCSDNYYRFTAGDIRFRDDALPYCNTAIAFEAPCLCDNRSWTMDVAAMFIGGWDRTQPRGLLPANHIARACFFAELAHGFRSFYFKYKDTGLWGIQFLANKMEMDMMLYNVQNEFMNMCLMITDNEVARAKHEMKTKLMTKLEGVTGTCFDLARWTLYYGQRPSLQEQLCEIERVTKETVRSECECFLYNKCPAVASVGPVESLPHNTRICTGQYWLKF